MLRYFIFRSWTAEINKDRNVTYAIAYHRYFDKDKKTVEAIRNEYRYNLQQNYSTV